MSRWMMGLAAGLVRQWVRVYTAGLSSSVRDGRRTQIESDLWEQEADAIANGYGLNEAALQVFSRFLLGLPADVSWRLEQTSAQRSTHSFRKESVMSRLFVGKVFLGVAVLATLTFAFLGLTITLHGIREGWGLGSILFLLEPMGAALYLTGLYLSKRSPMLGGGLVVVGALPLGALMLWIWALTVPVALLLAIFGIARARGFAAQRRATS